MRISDWSFRRVLFRSDRRRVPRRAKPTRLHQALPPSANGDVKPANRTWVLQLLWPLSYIPPWRDRKSVVWGKSVSGRVDHGGRRTIKTKHNEEFNATKQKQEMKKLLSMNKYKYT